MDFVNEVWLGYRPYLVRFTIDLLITGTLYIALFIFKLLTEFLPVGGWASDFIVHLHSAGVVGAVGVFALLSVIDLDSEKGSGVFS